MSKYSQPLAETLDQIIAEGIEGTTLAEPATKLDIIKLGLAVLRCQMATLDVSLSAGKSKDEIKSVAQQFGLAIGKLGDLIVELSPDHSERLWTILNRSLDNDG